MKFTNKNTFPSIEVYNDDVQPNWQDLQHPSVYEYRKALSIDRCSQNVLWRHISNFYRVEDIVIIIMWIYSFQTGWCTLYFSWVHIFIFIFIAIGKNGINMNANNVTKKNSSQPVSQHQSNKKCWDHFGRNKVSHFQFTLQIRWLARISTS